jgi:outer membrane protein TolC
LDSARRLPIDLPTALKLAAANNLQIAQAQARHREAKARKTRSAGAWAPSPVVGAQTGNVDGRVQGSFGDLKDVDYDTASLDGGLRWILNPGESLFDTLAASRLAEAQASDAEATRQQVLVWTARRYDELLRIQVSGATLSLRLANAKRRWDLARVLAGQGLLSGLETSRLAGEVHQREQEHRQAEENFRQASTHLAELLRLDPTVTLYPLDRECGERTLVAAELSLTDLVRNCDARNPGLESARKRVEAAAEAKKAARWGMWSHAFALIALYGGAGTHFGSLNHRTMMGASGGWNPSLSKWGDVGIAEARQALIDLSADEAALKTHASLARAYEEACSASARARMAKAETEASEAALRAAVARHGTGLVPESEVLQFQDLAAASRMRQVSAITDYNRAQAKLLAEVGEVGPESLVP